MPHVEPKVVAERVRFIFGDVAEKILQIEEQKLGISPKGPLGPEDLQRLAEDLKDLSQRMAGTELSHRVYAEVLALAAGAGSPGAAGSSASNEKRRSP